jgi:hypothetical protein
MIHAGQQLSGVLPTSALKVFEGQNHMIAAAAAAPAITEFLGHSAKANVTAQPKAAQN